MYVDIHPHQLPGPLKGDSIANMFTRFPSSFLKRSFKLNISNCWYIFSKSSSVQFIEHHLHFWSLVTTVSCLGVDNEFFFFRKGIDKQKPLLKSNLQIIPLFEIWKRKYKELFSNWLLPKGQGVIFLGRKSSPHHVLLLVFVIGTDQSQLEATLPDLIQEGLKSLVERQHMIFRSYLHRSWLRYSISTRYDSIWNHLQHYSIPFTLLMLAHSWSRFIFLAASFTRLFIYVIRDNRPIVTRVRIRSSRWSTPSGFNGLLSVPLRHLPLFIQLLLDPHPLLVTSPIPATRSTSTFQHHSSIPTPLEYLQARCNTRDACDNLKDCTRLQSTTWFVFQTIG